MTDRYRISAAPKASHRAPHGSLLRPALWVGLIVSAAANATASSIGAHAIGTGLGLVALACTAALMVHHYRHRAAGPH